MGSQHMTAASIGVLSAWPDCTKSILLLLTKSAFLVYPENGDYIHPLWIDMLTGDIIHKVNWYVHSWSGDVVHNVNWYVHSWSGDVVHNVNWHVHSWSGDVVQCELTCSLMKWWCGTQCELICSIMKWI